MGNNQPIRGKGRQAAGPTTAYLILESGVPTFLAPRQELALRCHYGILHFLGAHYQVATSGIGSRCSPVLEVNFSSVFWVKLSGLSRFFRLALAFTACTKPHHPKVPPIAIDDTSPDVKNLVHSYGPSNHQRYPPQSVFCLPRTLPFQAQREQGAKPSNTKCEPGTPCHVYRRSVQTGTSHTNVMDK